MAEQATPPPSFISAFKSAMSGSTEAPAKPADPPAAPTQQAAPEAAHKPDVTQSKPDKRKRFDIGDKDPVVQPPDKTSEKKETKPAEPANADEKPVENLRRQYEATKAELEKLRSERTTQSPIDTSEYERIRGERDELLKSIERLRIEESPVFKEKFEKPIESAIKRAKALVGDDVGPKLEWLLRQPHSDARTEGIEAALADLSPVRQMEVARLAGTISDVIADRTTELENNGQRVAAHQQEQERQRKQWSEKLFSDTLKAATDELPMFQSKEGDDAHNRQVQARVDKARKFLTGENDPVELAEAAFWAVTGQEVMPLLSAAKSEIAKLQGELDQLRSSRPTLSAAGGATESDGRPKNFVDAVRKAMTT